MLSLGSALGVAAFGQNLFGAFTPAGRLLGSEPAGFAIDFANDSALIRWPSSPASQYSGNIAGLISAGVLSFSRASTATYFDANGVMQTASNDVLRRAYDPTTKAALGYLPEPQRTNLLKVSEQFNDATWAKGAVTIQADAAVSPDGTATMDKIIEDSTTAFHAVSQYTATQASGTTAVVSVHAKAAERTAFRLQQDSAAGTGTADFDLSSGSVMAFSGTVSAAGMVSLGGGTYRCWMRLTTTASAGIGCKILPKGPSAVYGASYTGDGASGLYVWGAECKVGAELSSYIPTTSSTVTRAADALSADLSKLPFSSSVGSLITIAQPSPDTTSNGFGLAQLDDGSDNNRIGLTNGTAGSKIARATIVNSGSADADISSASNAAANRFKQALAWAANDIEMVVGGVASTKDTSCAVPSGLTTLRIGSKVAASTQWSAPIGNAVYIPRRLSQAELIARTS